MENYKLNSEIRDGAGKGVARKLRAKGQVPAILYGRKDDIVCLSLTEKEIKKVLQAHPESAIVDLAVSGQTSASCNAIVREVQRHPATGQLLHIDLQRIKMDEKVRVQVPIHLLGDAKGVKVTGGILEHGMRELTITCMPAAIPSAIEIDVAALEIGDGVYLRDISSNYPDFEFNDDEDTILANVVPPKVEVAPVAVEGALEEPELVAKDKEGAEGDKPGKEDKGEDKKK
ncbi:MAG: 50S ribosomal protein L25 [Candidatus Latescibacterota bacterium]